MTPPVDKSVVAEIRASANARKVEFLLRDLKLKIKTATEARFAARTRYDLVDTFDLAALLSAREDVMRWAVRRQTLIECWEVASGAVWASGIKDENGEQD